MKKLFSITTLPFIFLCQFLFIQNSNGQGWFALSSGIGAGLEDVTSYVNALTSDTSNLYAAGYFNLAGGSGVTNLAEWDGQSWIPMGEGVVVLDSLADMALTTYDGYVILGGYFNTVGNGTAFNVAEWNGTNWAGVGEGIGLGYADTFSRVSALAVSGDGNLYAGGFFDTAGGVPANNIAVYNGSAWSGLGEGIGTGILDSASWVYAIAGGGDSVTTYAAGFFSVAGGSAAYNVAQWNDLDSSWSALSTGIGNGLGDNSSVVYAMLFNNGILYAGGYFQTAGGSTAYNIAQWDGTSWKPLGSGIGSGAGDYNSAVFSMTIYGGNLVVGGHFNFAGGDSAFNLAVWDISNSTWSPLGAPASNFGIGNGITDSTSDVYALTLYGDGLYIGGYFDTAANMPAFNVVGYGHPEGIAQVAEKNTVSIYPNPNNGNLTISLQILAETAELQIYNVLGAKVYESRIPSGNTEINMSDEAAGPYFYRVCTTEGNLISTGKFIIQ